ncbi:hypothetical protein SDC9_161838 [bioreactor metagenome]|uniref:Uncharacterized protein n=1 Tax=bioreactor metagenome TaxID=1076179 RepID=A0A645FJF8_9ZZZZ
MADHPVNVSQTGSFHGPTGGQHAADHAAHLSADPVGIWVHKGARLRWEDAHRKIT